jgi:hypothetical protein
MERDGSIDVSVRRRCKVQRSGIRARSRPSLLDSDIISHRLIPVTNPVRTLVDLAPVLGAASLERAVNDADKRDLVNPEGLREAIEGFQGQPG